jgi:SAM-dependent methyltransferase
MTYFRRFTGSLLIRWINFWRRVEGPELEPPIWHSHFLTHFVSKHPLNQMGNQLKGLVIDIGAGTGHGARYLNSNDTEYFPTDLPTGRDAEDQGISRQSRAPVFHCSVYDLPFPDLNFSGAMLLSVLEHLEHPQKALKEVFRVLSPGSYVLVSTPFTFPVHGAPWDFRRWTLAGMKAELQDAGFEVVRAVHCGGGAAALVMNLHMYLRSHFLGENKVGILLRAIFLPFSLPFQALMNVLAILLDRSDRTASGKALSLCICVLAKRPDKKTCL